MLCDMHTHSSFSPDADKDALIVKMAERAKELGLGYITVTDHCDCNYWYPSSETAYPAYRLQDEIMFGSRDYALASIESVSSLGEKYPQLLCGIELGQPLQDKAAAGIITGSDKLDFIIGSLHMNSGRPDFYWIDHRAFSLDEIDSLLTDYFSELLEMSLSCDFDVLGHLTYPLRYIVGEYGLDIDAGKYEAVIREIFTALINRGKGIEINTSGLRQKYGRTFPDLHYVKLYKELGGEILTLGSDAHKIQDIGKGLSEGAELAQLAGFRYTAVYKKRKPEFIPL